MISPRHPGIYIRENVIPPNMPVKEAARVLGVGRPALSNLLNGKAALSREMASRLEKAFGADPQELLKLQADFDRCEQQSTGPKLVVGRYVPSFLKITAKNIEQWVEGNLEARSLLPVLLRKLVNSTGQNLSVVDFPGYDQSERKGWDGRVDAGAATPWIPIGQSGWEFGCSEDPKQKADNDYAARMKAISPADRAEMHFVFVTPRKWNGKDNWRKGKEALGDWKSVRAYDAGDIEQWLEQSLQAQGWLSERMGSPGAGVHSLEDRWRVWAAVTDPELSKELFAPSVEHFKTTVKGWIENPTSSPLIISGDSKLEALAFLYCMFESDELAFKNFKDRLLVFSSAKALHKLTTASPAFIPVVFNDAVERELGGAYKNRHAIIVRPRNTVQPEPAIMLDLLRHDAFTKALETMGIKDHLKIDDLARESGYSPTILRRRLAKVPAIRVPEWAGNSSAVRRLLPMMLVGAWHTQSKGDSEIMSALAGKSCNEIENDVAELLEFDDPPIWSVGTFRGVSSKIDSFFAAQTAVTQKHLEEFLFAAEIVLSERDPALALPEDKRAFANIYGKPRDHSRALRDGICETLVLLAVHGNDLFEKRLGLQVRTDVDMLIRRLLTPLTPEKLLSQTDNLPLYAEAAPQEFLRIIEDDLKSADPKVYTLMQPAATGLFNSCPRTGLLWALENLAWKADRLPRVSLILAKLAERKINDNWVNKPEHSLQAIFRSWMPQTAAPVEDRKKALEILTRRFPATAWKICIAQFPREHHAGEYGHRPRWRNDASGAGQPISTWPEIDDFNRNALNLALAWPSHDENSLGDLVENLQSLPEADQKTVWKLAQKWAATESDENRKAQLRERIRRFAFVGRSSKQGLTAEMKDLARKIYDLLTPTDLIVRIHWLFEQPWVQESLDELDEPEVDYQNRDEKIRQLRIAALQEIWEAVGFEGIKALLSKSGAASTIGWHMAEGVIASAGAASFLEQCLKVQDQNLTAKFDHIIRAFLLTLDPATRVDVTHQLEKVLTAPLLCRLFKHSPFQHDTWEYVDAQPREIREQYWREVHSDWLRRDSPDLNEVVDRLLAAGRPRAAFFAVHFALEEVETSRLKRLLQEIGTCDTEAPGTYRMEADRLAEGLSILQSRVGVSEGEMAHLEFLFISALKSLDQPFPNLEKQVGKSPALFVQALAMIFRRDDGGEDPPEWEIKDADRNSAIGTAAYRLVENVKRIPGTDDTGKINQEQLLAWMNEAQALCVEYGRADIGEQKIGQVLSAAPVGKDGVWPCEEVRNALEECGTPNMRIGIQVGVYKSRGAHFRAEGGEQERALAEKYRNWFRVLAFEYPYVASLVEGIAEEYDRGAQMWDLETAVRRRLTR
jgi:addiction module HigA family antidote